MFASTEKGKYPRHKAQEIVRRYTTLRTQWPVVALIALSYVILQVLLDQKGSANYTLNLSVVYGDGWPLRSLGNLAKGVVIGVLSLYITRWLLVQRMTTERSVDGAG